MDYTKKLPILEETDFQLHKLETLPIIEKYQYFNSNKARAMIDCGSALQFGMYRHVVTHEEQKKLEMMYTCKDKFCPFCAWRRARKLGIQSYIVLDALQRERNVRYIFLTLTVRNCHVTELRKTIDRMNKAFVRMFRWSRLKQSVLGYVRALEIPPQKDDMSMIHPHFHCLLVVPSVYFDKSSYDLYIKQSEWVELWQKALDVDYLPSVDVRVIKLHHDDPIAKVVAETIKYPLKPASLVRMPLDYFQCLVHEMSRKRMIFFGGILREYRKRLVLDDVEDGNLIYEFITDPDLWERIRSLVYFFQQGQYGLQYYLDSTASDLLR